MVLMVPSDVIGDGLFYLKKKDSQAFIYVQKAIVTIAKEKQQQQDILAILLFFIFKMSEINCCNIKYLESQPTVKSKLFYKDNKN